MTRATSSASAAPGTASASESAGTSGTSGTAPAVPAYGSRSLSDLLPSFAAVLGVPGFVDVIGVPAASRICLLIIDGLGAELLGRHGTDAPFLTALAGRPPLTAGFPATTATSMASLGTGLPPGEHGMLGYQVRQPVTGELLNLLRWDKETDPLTWQPSATMFEQVVAGGVPAFHVGPSMFRKSALTKAVWRGASYVGADTAGDLVAATAATVAAEPRSLTVSYYAAVDGTGHLRGSASPAWAYELALADRLVSLLASALPPDALLLVTGDHGMVDVADAGRLDVDATPALRDGVALIGGEPRARHVYGVPGAEADVLATWRELLGSGAWVLSRDESVAAGWFGPAVRPEYLPRIGDVVVAPGVGAAVVARTTEPLESSLIGLHGSLTSADAQVPLLVAQGGAPLAV